MKKRLCICLMFLSLIIGLIPTQADTVFAQDDKSECMLLEECKGDVHSSDCPMYKDSIASKVMSDDNSWEECDDCSKDQPHMISTTSDLDKVRTHIHTKDGVTIITGYFKLANDIVFKDEDFEKDGDFYNDGQTWIPIGHKNVPGEAGAGFVFCGQLDGSGFSVKNLKMTPIDSTKRNRRYCGIFSQLGEGGNISNITFEGIKNTTKHGPTVVVGKMISKDAKLSHIFIKKCEVTAQENSNVMPETLLSQTLMGQVSDIMIQDSQCGSTSWYGGIVACTISDVKMSNIIINNCNYSYYAQSGLMFRNVHGKNSIENVSIADTKYTFSHSNSGRLVYSMSEDSILVMENINIDITYDAKKFENFDVVSIPENSNITFNNFHLQYHLEGLTPTMARWWNAIDEMARGKGKANLSCVDAKGDEAKIISYENAYYIVKNTPTDVIKSKDFLVGHLNGGEIPKDANVNMGNLITPVKEGSIFEGWYEDRDFNGNPVDKVETEKTYYAKWTGIEPLEVEYKDTDQIKVTGEVTELKNWKSDNENIATVDAYGNVKGINVGTAKISVTGTYNGQSMTFTTTVTVRPMNIIYGSADNQQDGRPYVVYSLKENGKVPLISDILGFYPTIKQSDGTYKADTSKERIILNPGMGNTGDVEYTYIDSASGNKVTTGSLPLHPTLNEMGEPHSIRVEMKIKNPNYRFTTVGTNWKPGDTIVLFVTCHEEGMNEVDMYLKGEDSPLETFEDRREYEYTGEGIVPTSKDLTSLYTKGKNTAYIITKFTAHFHAVEEGSKFDGTHLTAENSGLTKDALQAIAPKEMGVYSFVVNGYNRDTKTYCYASRRYRIVKGKPKGEPKIQYQHSEITLSEIELTGTMENAAGKKVEGKFIWNEPETKVKEGTKYTWSFIPEDEEHYETVEGESVVRHQLEALERKEASCREEGQIESYYCKECDKYFRDDKGQEEMTKEEVIIKATGHKYGEWVVTKEATEEESGQREKICERCGEKVEEEIPAIRVDVTVPEEEKDNQTTAKPKTEDSSNIMIYVLIGGLTIAGTMIVVLNKKREDML